MIYALTYFTVSILWVALLKFLKTFEDNEYLTANVLWNFFFWPISMILAGLIIFFTFPDQFVRYIFKS